MRKPYSGRLPNSRLRIFSTVAAVSALVGMSMFVQAGSLTVEYVVGTRGGPGFVDGARQEARFREPWGMALDEAGNLLVSDHRNHTIRRIDADGTVSTFAGVAEDFGSADGRRSGARFVRPRGIALDRNGNLFVADYYWCTVRKITPAGEVSTFAGSPGKAGNRDGVGEAARFNLPADLAIDAEGNIFVADELNSMIRKITPDQTVTRYAGEVEPGGIDGPAATARFAFPQGIAVAPDGTVYVADTGNGVVRRISFDGTVSTVAGNLAHPAGGSVDGWGEEVRFRGVQGMSLDCGGNLFVADRGNSTIRKIEPSGLVTTIAGAPLERGSTDGPVAVARFNKPSAVYAAPDGRVFISEEGNHSIRVLSPSGEISTIAGLAIEGGNVGGPGDGVRVGALPDVAWDPRTGITYAPDALASVILAIAPDGTVTNLVGFPGSPGFVDGVCGSAARLSSPLGITISPDGQIFFSDSGNNVIRRVDPQTGCVATWAGVPGVWGHRDGDQSTATFALPWGVTVSDDGTLYVADSDSSSIRRVSVDRQVTTLAGGVLYGGQDGTGSAAGFDNPRAIEWEPIRHVLYVADGDTTIRRVTPEGVVSTIAGSYGQYGFVDARGALARFNSPYGLACDSNGNVYIGDLNNHVIRKMDLNGNVSTALGKPGYPGTSDGTGFESRLGIPMGLTFAARQGSCDLGTLLIADYENYNLRAARCSISDIAGIDRNPGFVGQRRQLSTYPDDSAAATSWKWKMTRRPAGSHAQLSRSDVRSPSFIPDVADLYEFEVRAEGPDGVSITRVKFEAVGSEAHAARPEPVPDK